MSNLVYVLLLELNFGNKLRNTNFGSLIRFCWNHCIAITCAFKIGGVYMSISRPVKWNAMTSILNIMASNYQSEFQFCLRDQSETYLCGISWRNKKSFWQIWDICSVYNSSKPTRERVQICIKFIKKRIGKEKNSAWDLSLYPYNCISLEKTCEP